MKGYLRSVKNAALIKGYHLFEARSLVKETGFV